MKTELVDIETLTPDPDNERKHDTKNLSAIRGSIKQFGIVEPLIVRKQNNVVLGGNGRLQVLKEMGVKQVPVHFVDLDATKAKALRLALNRTSELASWDDDLLKETLAALSLNDFDISDIGFDAKDFNFLDESTVKISENKEYSAESFDNFQHQCPRCGFEFTDGKDNQPA